MQRRLRSGDRHPVFRVAHEPYEHALCKLIALAAAQRALGHEVPGKKNVAKRIAAVLYRKYPIIYGGQDHIDAVVTRWRGQIAENSKTLSSSHLFPEMNHNEIVGWEHPGALLKDLAVVILRDSGDHPRTSKRVEITKGILEKDPFQILDQEGVGQLVEIGIQRGRSTRPELKVGICGEHGGNPQTVAFCHKVGMNYVSCSPFRVPIARLAAAQASLQQPVSQATV